MDLLGSILGSMQKPPTMGDAEKKKAKEQKERLEKHQQAEKKKLDDFRGKIRKRIHEFVKDGSKQKYSFEPMDKCFRAIVHEITDVAGMTSFSFGLEEEDRYVMLWKKEFAPTDEELAAYRKGEDWDPDKAKEIAKQKEIDRLSEEAESRIKHPKVMPASNYQDKYRHLIGEEAAKEAARTTTANKSYGFVPSENKLDHRTIEQVLADTRAKKKQKTEEGQDVGSGSQSEDVTTAKDNEDPSLL
ncbi:sperm-associated antigen 7 homolog [Mizuhopecten yessoensis]|uniref:Sperm-associated antigen 7-like n=1 Tax=Mizuhopecten yessoensis TaxID=6573 RepID=A0A210Q5Q6_MIZYE|nr:sperm-associated antigen 7 homolog [Mizuhopecten yessoensis]OWF44051.1 Sperm-associated antigen 7-like [Mizuhopecten yessoensis]